APMVYDAGGVPSIGVYPRDFGEAPGGRRLRTRAGVLSAGEQGLPRWYGAAAHRILPPRRMAVVSGGVMRVLLVDDSESFLASTERFIQTRDDLELVGTARTGIEALDAVTRLGPDLVIVEAALTGMDGFRVARQLKSRGDAPLVLLVTFYPSVAAR